jgi:hypothetical protein
MSSQSAFAFASLGKLNDLDVIRTIVVRAEAVAIKQFALYDDQRRRLLIRERD